MNNKAPVKNYFENWRLNVFFILMTLVFGYYLVRLFDLQIVQGKDYLAQADENRITKISEPALRGNIYDRNNFLLAGNIPSYNISITPAYLPEDTGALQTIYRDLSTLIGSSSCCLVKKLKKPSEISPHVIQIWELVK